MVLGLDDRPLMVETADGEALEDTVSIFFWLAIGEI